MMPVKEASDLFGLTPHRLKQIIKTENFSIEKQSNGYIRVPSKTMSLINHLREIHYEYRIVTIGMEKGGIGKTILTINLAMCAARKGLKVLICDFDPECCATLFLAPDETDWDKLGSIREVFENDKQILDYTVPSRFDGVDFLPSRSRVRKVDRNLDGENPKFLLQHRMQGVREEYDLVLFDIPPSFNNLCRSSYLTSDIVICPVLDDVFSIESLHLTLEDIEEACTNFEKTPPIIKVLRNRFSALSPKSGKVNRRASKDIGVELNREFPDILLPLQVRETEAVKNSLNNGHSFFSAPKDPRLEDVKSAIEDLFKVIQACQK